VGPEQQEIYLNLVTEFVPENLERVLAHFKNQNLRMPLLLAKVYTFQLLRALAYLHSLGVCHRDIKPENLLIEPQTQRLKLADFGSAKVLEKGLNSVPYVSMRCVRAPELLMGNEFYSHSVDTWAAGCILACMLKGQFLFEGASNQEVLVCIFRILGTPNQEQLAKLAPEQTLAKETEIPQIQGSGITAEFSAKVPPEALDLVKKMLVYTPSRRIKPVEALAHPFFDELRKTQVSFKNG